MGLIHQWSRLASKMPWIANAMTQTPGLSTLAKWVADISPNRKIPRFANLSFSDWFHRRGQAVVGPRVMLWPDTFNNYFRPETAIAATEVLEGLGYEVVIPNRPLCCGRPLYDWGMLDRAKRQWRKILDSLREDIDAGTPIVGLEPACVSAFRDELPSLFPADERARQLSERMFMFTEFLDRHRGDLGKHRNKRKALVQIHCHHHAVIKPDAELHVLDTIGLDYEVMKSGCCGMAGSFGFETAKYPVSIAAAERVLLPKIASAPDSIILANGFSCREQIEQSSGRPTLHIAELLAACAPRR
jgi:Fe-S oxidoreductase